MMRGAGAERSAGAELGDAHDILQCRSAKMRRMQPDLVIVYSKGIRHSRWGLRRRRMVGRSLDRQDSLELAT